MLRVKHILDPAHQSDGALAVLGVQIALFRIADAVLAGYQTAKLGGFLIHAVEANSQRPLPCGLLQIVAADVDVQIAEEMK